MHSNSIEIAIQNRRKLVAHYSTPATIAAVTQVLGSLNGKKHMAIEEGPMAGWLYRNLNKKVDKFIASDPRRNKLISSDGDSDDRIDATKLAFRNKTPCLGQTTKHVVNEPQPSFCYASIICMDCSFRASPL